jgi:succinoglycan biosynthesis protein ExoA
VGALAGPLVRGEADITAGPDIAPADDPFLARCEDVAFRSLIGSGGVRGSQAAVHVEFCPMSCNMALRRETMLKLGCFDERLRFVEDTDFVYRAKDAGLKVKFVPEGDVRHRRRATVRQVCHHNYVRGYGRAWLHGQYPRERHYAFFLPPVGLLGAAALLLAGFFYPPAWWGLGLGAFGYLLILAVVGLQGLAATGRPVALVAVPFLVAMHHLWYAFGILHAPMTRYRKLFALDRTDIADPFGVRAKK